MSNFVNCFVLSGISTGCHYKANSFLIFKLQLNIFSFDTVVNGVQQVVFQQWKDYLSFRISGTHIIFKQMTAFFSNHKSEEDKTLKHQVIIFKTCDCRLQDILAEIHIMFCSKLRSWRHATHPTCVWSAVTGTYTFIILCRNTWKQILTIGEADY